MKTFLILWSSVFISLTSFQAIAQRAELQFFDDCSGVIRGLTTPNGTKVRITFKDLKTTSPIDLTLTYALAGIPDDQVKKNEFSEEYHYDPSGISEEAGKFTVEYELPNDEALSEVEEKFPGSRIWVVKAEWRQELFAGNAVGSIYRTEGADSFYRVTSTTRCNWETNPVVSSKYYLNRDQPLMTVNRMVNFHDHAGFDRGREVGIGNNYPQDANGIPTRSGNFPLPFMPYYLKQQTVRSDLQLSFVLNREWILIRGQGGLFADRYSFDRMNADRYDWIPQENGCGDYIKVKSGFLDVGVHTSDFYSLPASLVSDGEKALKFINSVRPPLDTCDQTYPKPGITADVKITGLDEILFFHETKPAPNNH